MNSFYSRYFDKQEATISLTGGKSYYIEVYHINYAGPGFLEISVEVPNTDPKAIFQVYEVDKIITGSTVQSEVMVFTMTASTSGTIQLEITRTNADTFETTTTKTNVSYACSADDFRNALNRFDGYSSYNVTVTRNIYDGSDQIITNVSAASKIEYVAEIYRLRPDNYQK